MIGESTNIDELYYTEQSRLRPELLDCWIAGLLDVGTWDPQRRSVKRTSVRFTDRIFSMAEKAPRAVAGRRVP